MKSPQLVENLVWRETDDGIVVVDPVEGRVRVLNGVGSIIWKQLNKSVTLEAMREHLVEQFEISAERAREDIDTFLSQLTERKMIVWE